MKKKRLSYKTLFFITCGGILIPLLFFSIKYNVDTTYLLRDILYFPINIFVPNNKIVLEDHCSQLQEELNYLKGLLEINNTLSDFSIVSSTVINRNANYWSNELTINKGSRDNIKVGMAVIDNRGLIGKIDKVGLNTSIVKLITNNSNGNKISVKIGTGDNSINKILEVDENNNLVIFGIDNNYEVKLGDIVTTSGLSDLYPSGIMIGKIEKIEDDKFGISKKIYIKHASNLDNIRFVSVLLRG